MNNRKYEKWQLPTTLIYKLFILAANIIARNIIAGKKVSKNKTK